MVLDKLKSYFHSLSARKDLFLQEKSTISKNGICCIEIDSHSFSLAYARLESGKLNLVACANYPYSTKDDLHESLTTIVKYYKLDGVSCSLILEPDQYQILLMDALPVPASEFQAAIRWKIKDLIRYPIDDIVVDSFPLPIKKASTGQEVIMVVVSKLSDLRSVSDDLKRGELNLNKISILELSLRNIANLFNQVDKTTALLYLQEKNSQLILTAKKELHFARRIEWGVTLLDAIQESDNKDSEIALRIDRLALEVQRSFDYYQSQWREPIPTRIIFSAVKSLPMNFASLLSERLSIPVEILNLTAHFNNTKVLSVEDQGKYLPILGEIFQHEGNTNVATN